MPLKWNRNRDGAKPMFGTNEGGHAKLGPLLIRLGWYDQYGGWVVGCPDLELSAKVPAPRDNLDLAEFQAKCLVLGEMEKLILEAKT